MIDVGRITVPCPHCESPLAVFATSEAMGRKDGAITVGISVDRDRLAAEVERHVAEHHDGA